MRNDRYVLSQELPKLSRVGATKHFDLYPKTGDTIWYPNFCEVIKMLVRRRIEFGQTLPVDVQIKAAGEIIQLEETLT